MNRVILIFIVLSLVLLLSFPAAAEFYEYTDESGNKCFTDDISEVPESQRDGVKRFESVKSAPRSSPDPGSSVKDKNRPESSPVQDSGTWDGQMKKKAEELEQENEELQKTFQELREQKQALQQKSTAQMTRKERNAHNQKIQELNSRISDYNMRKEEFSQKTKEYNASFQQNSPAENKEP